MLMVNKDGVLLQKREVGPVRGNCCRGEGKGTVTTGTLLLNGRNQSNIKFKN